MAHGVEKAKLNPLKISSFTSGQYGDHKTILYIRVLEKINATLKDFRMIHSMLDRKKLLGRKRKWEGDRKNQVELGLRFHYEAVRSGQAFV